LLEITLGNFGKNSKIAGTRKGYMTDQIPNKIIYEGKECWLDSDSNLTQNYFTQYPDKRPKSEVRSTGLYRGYVETFEIKDGQLYLKDIEIDVWDAPLPKSVINEVFPNHEFIKIDWTGTFAIPPSVNR